MMNPMKNVPKVGVPGSPLLYGVFYSAVWLAAGALLLSLLLRFSSMEESELPRWVWVIHAFSALAGGFTAGKRSGRRGWYTGGLLGLLYGMLILLIGFLAADAKLSSGSAVLMAVAAAAGAAGGMLGINTKK
jgi:putative membrane protein (TIGR04086 family)